MRKRSILFCLFLMAASTVWAQQADEQSDPKALRPAEQFFGSTKYFDYAGAAQSLGATWPTDPDKLAILEAFGFGSRKDKATVAECGNNLKNYATALEMYSTDWAGKFPGDPSKLTPNYLKTLPVCPASGAAYSYDVSTKPDGYTVTCPGNSHGRDKLFYSSVDGLTSKGEPWVVYLTDLKTSGDTGSCRLIRGLPSGAYLQPIADTTLQLKKTDGEWFLDASHLVEPAKKALKKMAASSEWISFLPTRKDMGFLMVLLTSEDPELKELATGHLCRYRLAMACARFDDLSHGGEVTREKMGDIGVCPVSRKPYGVDLEKSRFWCEGTPHGEQPIVFTTKPRPVFEKF